MTDKTNAIKLVNEITEELEELESKIRDLEATRRELINKYDLNKETNND